MVALDKTGGRTRRKCGSKGERGGTTGMKKKMLGNIGFKYAMGSTTRDDVINQTY